jgi:hypothetical protein
MSHAGSFAASLGSGIAIPVITTVLACVWKLLSKNKWVPDDFLVAVELLVAAICVQLTFIGQDVIEAVTPGYTENHRLAAVMGIRAGLLTAVGVVILPVFAVVLRYHTQQSQLTTDVAFRLSLGACALLVAVFVANYFLYAVV